MRKLKIAYFILAGVYAVMVIAIWSFGRVFLPILLPSCILLILGFSVKYIKSRFLHFCFIALGVVSVLLLLAALYAGLSFGLRYSSYQNEDSFGKDLVIPLDLKMEDPKEEIFGGSENSLDNETAILLGIFSQPDKLQEKPVVNTDLQILNMFAGGRKELLVRHLATSAKWVLTKDNSGKLYAYRRVFKNGFWQDTGGYFGSYDLDPFSGKVFQLGVRIGIDGAIMHSGEIKATITKVDSGNVDLKITPSMSPGLYSSYIIIKSIGPALEILEEEQVRERPLTPAVISLVNKELTGLIQSSDAAQKGFGMDLMPSESVKNGEPEIYLLGQGGAYQVYGHINPGEPGFVYLKVYEHTKNTPLSSTKSGKGPIEYIGWSDNPNQQFFYNSHIIIGEGGRGAYYPARFEIWFVPNSGKPERKIIEKVFKIEGYER